MAEIEDVGAIIAAEIGIVEPRYAFCFGSRETDHYL